VFAANTIVGVAKELQAVWAYEPVDDRNERLNATLRDATADLGRAVAGLVLDDGTEPVISRLTTIRGDFAAYEWTMQRVERHGPDLPDARREALDLLAKIERGSREIERLARSHLDA
jgi:hypothetical protein